MNRGLIKSIYRTKSIENIDKKIKLLGDYNMNSITFLSLRIFTCIILFIILMFSKVNYFLIPLMIIAYYNLFYYVLITNKIKKRTKKLDNDALLFFSILTLTLESGKNLMNSLEITCYNVDNELSKEFKRSLLEVKYGKSLMESLKDMKYRIPSVTINNIILNITQTSVFGNSIISVMNNQIDYLRDKQILDIKESINKIPNKVSIVSVIFIVPLILLIVLGPFIISLL